MQKSILFTLALACVFFQVYGAYPTGYRIDYCGDCPYSGCCNSNYTCALTISQCSYYGKTPVAYPTSTCMNSSCPYDCCINGVCGTYSQCYDTCYSGCRSGCCVNSRMCGSQSYCTAAVGGYRITTILGLTLASLLVLVGFIVCCKSCSLSSKYTKKTVPVGANPGGAVYTGLPNQQTALMQNQQGFNNYGYPQQQYTQTQFTQPQANYPQNQGYNPVYTQTPVQYGH